MIYSSFNDVTQAELIEHYDYDPAGGLILKKRHNIKVSKINLGRRVGTSGSCGYLKFIFKGKVLLCHAAIFLYHNGYLPENEIDHINRDRKDNRIENLREVHRVCNARNCSISKNSSTGVVGVCNDRTRGMFFVHIKVNYKQKRLGRFEDFTEAVSHRLAAEQCIGWSTCSSRSTAEEYMKAYLRGER